jgi:hypothetical protein
MSSGKFYIVKIVIFLKVVHALVLFFETPTPPPSKGEGELKFSEYKPTYLQCIYTVQYTHLPCHRQILYILPPERGEWPPLAAVGPHSRKNSSNIPLTLFYTCDLGRVLLPGRLLIWEITFL